MRIALIDDHPIIAEGLKAILTTIPGAEFCHAAQTVDQFWQYPELANLDIVFVDLSLQNEDGIHLISRLKDKEPHIKIIVLTAHTDPNSVIKSFRAGAQGYVSKLSAYEDISEAMTCVLSDERYISPSLKDISDNSSFENELEGLSKREQDVLVRLARGMTVMEIASDLNINRKTVSTYKGRFFKKLQISSIPDLVRYAIKKGIVKLNDPS